MSTPITDKAQAEAAEPISWQEAYNGYVGDLRRVRETLSRLRASAVVTSTLGQTTLVRERIETLTREEERLSARVEEMENGTCVQLVPLDNTADASQGQIA